MMETPLRRLRVLLESVFDGTGPDEDCLELTALVEQHRELTTPLIEQLRVHGLLQWQCDEKRISSLHVPALKNSRAEQSLISRSVVRTTL
jgi:hypothetical protein